MIEIEQEDLQKKKMKIDSEVESIFLHFQQLRYLFEDIQMHLVCIKQTAHK